MVAHQSRKELRVIFRPFTLLRDHFGQIVHTHLSSVSDVVTTRNVSFLNFNLIIYSIVFNVYAMHVASNG